MKVLLASRNEKKLEELRRILTPLVPDVEVLGLADVPAYDEPAETEPTFEGNALLKARAAVAATGLPSLADDSGICVDALNGMPGVLSARWSGPAKDNHANNVLLLGQLEDVPDERRGAAFVAAVAFCRPATPDSEAAAGSEASSGSEAAQGSEASSGSEATRGGEAIEEVVRGEMRGSVIRELRGSGGFGYDVLFVPEGYDRTTAELTIEEKDAISHRGKSLRAIAPVVAKVLSD